MQPELKGMDCYFPIAGNQPLLVLHWPISGLVAGFVSNNLHGQDRLAAMNKVQMYTTISNVCQSNASTQCWQALACLTCFRTACMAV